MGHKEVKSVKNLSGKDCSNDFLGQHILPPMNMENSLTKIKGHLKTLKHLVNDYDQ